MSKLLPVALITTFYSNPLTIVPLYALAYQLGTWVSGAHDGVAQSPFDFPEMHWHNWMSESGNWLAALGKPLLVRSPPHCVNDDVYCLWRVGAGRVLQAHVEIG